MNHELPPMPERAPEREATREMLERYVNDLEREAVKKVTLEKTDSLKQKIMRKIAIWKILTVLAIKL